MRNEAVGAVLDAVLDINEISAALVAERIKGATTEHTVEDLSRGFMAGKIFALLVLEI